MTTQSETNDETSQGKCPVLHYTDQLQASDALEHYSRFDEMRERAPFYSGDIADFVAITRADHQKEAFLNTSLFSSSSIIHVNPEPDFRWVPVNVDPPQHGQWRKLLGPLFSPSSVRDRQANIQKWCTTYLDQLGEEGCEFIEEFAFRYPTSVFMDLVGFPASDTAQFLAWEDATVRAPNWADQAEVSRVVGEILAYFQEYIAHRRAHPGDDIISQATQWEIDGKAVTDEEIQSLCLLLFMAGLDTVAMQTSFSFLHLATHPEDQQKLRENPDLAPSTIEEMMRLYSLVATSRKVTEDVDFHGVQLHKDQMVWLPLWMSNRDPRLLENPNEAKIDRKNNPNWGFGVGIHRCLGAHLAREEMRIALVDWHKRFPKYSLDPAFPAPKQRLASNMSLDAIHLKFG
ncbi:cytochrome P450 [Pseudonocardia ailaonensis]|uniref:Cytochrome P450 n=1 Tax=Pseudonocardia ailaonensis TaxID=367279 RepID=A0ABN2N9H8_9PSEU